MGDLRVFLGGWISVLMLSPWVCGQAAVGAAELFVATSGNDAWSGRFAEPNADKSDGPLASLQQARDEARKLKASGPVTVLVRGGTYHLEQPFVLEPQDSGTPERPVVFAPIPVRNRCSAAGGGSRVGSRGRVVCGRSSCRTYKPVSGTSGNCSSAAQRRQPARSPNEGYHRIAKLLPGPPIPNAKPVARDKFGFAPGDLQPWPQLNDVRVVLMHSWETSIHPLKSVDTATNTVEFAAPMGEWWSIGYWEDAQRYYVENAFELLDQPGEWYLNRATGVLSYWPLPGEQMDAVEVVAPVLPELVRLAGNADEGRFVEHVTIRGLTFHHADWILSPQGNSSTQAAVNGAGGRDGRRRAELRCWKTAKWPTSARTACGSAAAAKIAESSGIACSTWRGRRAGRRGDDGPTDETESSRIVVDNNHIFDGGHVYAAGIGVWVAQSSHNQISHNDIHDLLYSGISVGWNWGLEPNRTHHNVIEFNHVHDLVHGVLSDAGLIYCLGVSPGSVIRNNVFHDIWPYSTPPFGWGIYLDAQCGNYLVENNLVYNTRSGGLMFNNGGHAHVIRNNIFAMSADYGLWPYSEKRPSTFRAEHRLPDPGNAADSPRRTLAERTVGGQRTAGPVGQKRLLAHRRRRSAAILSAFVRRLAGPGSGRQQPHCRPAVR